MPTKLILFAGAPSPSAVTEASCTLSKYVPPFTSFLDLPKPSPQTATISQPLAAWRSLPLSRQPLHTGFTQSHSSFNDDVPRDAGFFSTADVSIDDVGASMDDETVQEALTQFFEASLSAMENTSLLSGLDSFEASFMTTSSLGNDSRNSQRQLQQQQQQQQQQRQQPVPAHLSDLEDIPPAPQIIALNPSTVTLNLIVGILSIAQPRTVTTRWGKAMSLVELLVGDESRSGFAVTFWIPESENQDSPITKLRRQDVVLLQNVALHVFRGKVYGQSLRRDMTKVSILWGPDGRGAYMTRQLAKTRASQPQLQKTKLVKDWVLQFVGADPRKKTASKRKLRSWDEPPPDSQ